MPDLENLSDAYILAPRILLPLKITKEHVSLDFSAHPGGKVFSKVFLNELKWFKFMVGLICVYDIDLANLSDLMIYLRGIKVLG